MKHTQKERELKDLKKKKLFFLCGFLLPVKQRGFCRKRNQGLSLPFFFFFFFKEMVSAGPPKMAYNLQGRFNQTVNQNETSFDCFLKWHVVVYFSIKINKQHKSRSAFFIMSF